VNCRRTTVVHLNLVYNLEGRDLALAMHIEALMNRIKVHQLDIVRLDLALFQPRGQFLEKFSRKFVVFDGSLQTDTVSE
jgi:hypothetical protein